MSLCGSGLTRNLGYSGQFMRHKGLTLPFVLSIIFISAASGAEPECDNVTALPTVKNVLSRLVLAASARTIETSNLKPLEQFDFSPSVALDEIIVVKWDADTKTALCRANFKLDGPALMKIAVSSAPQVTNLSLKHFLEDLKPDYASVGFGQIAYSVQPKSDGGLSVQFLDLAQGVSQ